MLTRLLSEQRKRFRPDDITVRSLKQMSVETVRALNQALKKKKIRAQVFVGGSFAKNTLVRKSDYDIDIFVRFANESAFSHLNTLVSQMCKEHTWSYQRIHGSRDYYRIVRANIEKAYTVAFEIVPVMQIKRPQQAINVTDLSYFHVSYVKKKASKLSDDIRLAKQFCRAAGVYGAESYIQGFSGYALEGLIIYYKGFLPFLRSLRDVKERVVIDPARQYRTGREALLSLNEAKTQSPIVLVDPTFKERNALAALSRESFEKFQRTARAFLARPSVRFFEEQPFSREMFVKKAHTSKNDAYEITLHTDRQHGDIAGTKLKRCADFITRSLDRWFDVHDQFFMYEGAKEAHLYLALRKKQIVEQQGPPLSMKEHVARFKKMHTKTFTRKDHIWASVNESLSLNDALKQILHSKDQTYSMGLTEWKLETH